MTSFFTHRDYFKREFSDKIGLYLISRKRHPSNEDKFAYKYGKAEGRKGLFGRRCASVAMRKYTYVGNRIRHVALKTFVLLGEGKNNFQRRIDI